MNECYDDDEVDENISAASQSRRDLCSIAVGGTGKVGKRKKEEKKKKPILDMSKFYLRH